MASQQGYCLKLGTVEYMWAWELQKKLSEARRARKIGDGIIILEHQPCFTIGRGGGFDHLLADPEFLRAQGIEVYETDRGGDITYHGPGQMVCYPILDLSGYSKDVHRYAWLMEEVLIKTLAAFGIFAQRHPHYPGVWVNSAKIAAEGISVQRWVTMHGIALNVSPDLNHFGFIIPCGISHLGVTSMEKVLGQTVDMTSVVKEFRCQFEEAFTIQLQETDLATVMAAMEEDTDEQA